MLSDAYLLERLCHNTMNAITGSFVTTWVSHSECHAMVNHLSFLEKYISCASLSLYKLNKRVHYSEK